MMDRCIVKMTTQDLSDVTCVALWPLYPKASLLYETFSMAHYPECFL